MTRTKFVLVVALIALFIGGSTTYGLAEVRYYTVTNDTDYTAEVILCWTWGSQYIVKIYAHKSYAFPDDSPYHCPSGLKGKLSYGIFTTDIVPICLKTGWKDLQLLAKKIALAQTGKSIYRAPHLILSDSNDLQR